MVPGPQTRCCQEKLVSREELGGSMCLGTPLSLFVCCQALQSGPRPSDNDSWGSTAQTCTHVGLCHKWDSEIDSPHAGASLPLSGLHLLMCLETMAPLNSAASSSYLCFSLYAPCLPPFKSLFSGDHRILTWAQLLVLLPETIQVPLGLMKSALPACYRPFNCPCPPGCPSAAACPVSIMPCGLKYLESVPSSGAGTAGFQGVPFLHSRIAGNP